MRSRNLNSIAEDILDVLDERIPGLDFPMDLILAQGVYHATKLCQEGEKVTLSLRSLTTLANSSLCQVCSKRASYQGFSLDTLWGHLQEFHILANMCEAPVDLDTLYGCYAILEKYVSPSAGRAFRDASTVTFPQALEEWSVGVAKNAQLRFAQLTEDLKGALGKEIIRNSMRKMSSIPETWDFRSASARKRAEKLYQEVEDDLLDDPSLFLVIDSYQEPRESEHKDLLLLGLLKRIFPAPGPNLLVVPASFAALIYGENGSSRREANCARLEASDSSEVLQAAARLHADEGVYSSISVALEAARSLV